MEQTLRYEKRIRLSLRLLFWGLVAGLAACAAPMPPDQASTEAPANAPANAPAGAVAPPAGRGDVVRPGSGTGAAVRQLLADASRAERAGNLPTTEALLERALHIEPRNPVLWYYMARLRVRQGRFAQARALAARSNSLAANDTRLQIDNWKLIAYASEQLGDQRSASQARERAARLGAR